MSETIDGTAVIDATLTGLDGKVFVDELRRLTDTQRLADAADGVVRTARQRRAAALVEMATRSASMPAGARRPRPLFTVLVGDDTFRHLCETSAGRVVPPDALTPHLDTADMEVVLFDGPATVLSVSPRRSFTGALRRAIEVRDRHCQHPAGSDVPVDRCDVDHVVPWTAGAHRPLQRASRVSRPQPPRRSPRHRTEPPPARGVEYLDHVRARLRWRLLHEPPDDLAV